MSRVLFVSLDEGAVVAKCLAAKVGISAIERLPAGGDDATTGELGLRFDRIAYENDGRFVVTEVVALGPADIADIAAGDVVMAVDGVALGVLVRRLAASGSDSQVLFEAAIFP